MEYQKYKSINEAIFSVLRKDQEYIMVRHELKKGESICRHLHPLATEWIIIDNGSLEARADDESESFNLKNESTTIKFMVSQKHSIIAKSDIAYYVIRDHEDKTVYSNNLF